MMLDGARHAAVDGGFDAKSCLSSVSICVICGEKQSWDHRCLGWAQMGFGGYFFLKVVWMGLALVESAATGAWGNCIFLQEMALQMRVGG
jgi:hypothetical protein